MLLPAWLQAIGGIGVAGEGQSIHPLLPADSDEKIQLRAIR